MEAVPPHCDITHLRRDRVSFILTIYDQLDHDGSIVMLSRGQQKSAITATMYHLPTLSTETSIDLIISNLCQFIDEDRANDYRREKDLPSIWDDIKE